ncbi:transcriptional regulator, y4mF family [compost metagenome]
MPVIRSSSTGQEIAEEIGARLRIKRLERNITIDALAKRAGVGRSAVGDIEAGRDVRMSTLIKVMRALGVVSNLEAAFPDTLPTSEALNVRGQVRLRAHVKKNAPSVGPKPPRPSA